MTTAIQKNVLCGYKQKYTELSAKGKGKTEEQSINMRKKENYDRLKTVP